MPKARSGKDRIKVSATIGTGEHERLVQLAERGHTTVGIIVGTAVLAMIQELEAHPRRLTQLPRDPRRVE